MTGPVDTTDGIRSVPRAGAMSLLQARSIVKGFLRRWTVRSVDAQLAVSDRLTTTLARCWPRTGRIELSARALRMPARLPELLCHEAAHLAVFALHGPNCRPHGPEWQALMRQAGFKPRATLVSACRVLRPKPAPASVRWEHVCPVCQTTRTGKRPVPRWRCAACVAAGLDGKLTIRRRPAPEARSR
ncbi:MAG: SprT family zinc-dependent metalloprotease [Vicinamibacterales bacterium]